MVKGGVIYEDPGPSSEVICKLNFCFYKEFVPYSPPSNGQVRVLVLKAETNSKNIYCIPQTKTQAVQKTGRVLYLTCDIPMEWNYDHITMAATDFLFLMIRSNLQDRKL